MPLSQMFFQYVIPINYVMGSNIYSPSLPTILEAYARKYKFKQQQKHTEVMKITNFDLI